MSAHRITHNVLRHGPRYAYFHQAPVQAQNEPHNEEQNEIGRLSEAVIPLINLVSHRTEPNCLSTNFIIPTAWPIPSAFNGREGRLNKWLNESHSRGIQITLPKKKSTVEVSVQTELSGDGGRDTSYEKLQLQLENQIGVELMKEGLPEDAVKHFLHASENGNAEAMNNLADCLFNGNGAKENKREAWRLWKQAAQLGHSTAMYNLAVCHIGGDGTPENETEGLHWMWNAANSGNADASFYLVLKLIHEGDPGRARRLVQCALRDANYNTEFHTWIRDKVVDEHALKMLREELGLE